MSEDWRSSLDNKQDVAVVTVDLSKAFDSICHNLLLAKLKAYGLNKPAVDLIRSYLQDRKQRVKCNNVFSDWRPSKCGVPQGSLLGPLLFNIFINDLNEMITISSLRLYADDTTNYTSDDCPVRLELAINNDITSLGHWLNINFLTLNPKKTQAMIMGNSKYDYEIRVNDLLISSENNLKILGVTLDNHLTFQPHIKETLKKVYAKIAALRRLRRLISTEVMIKLYKAYILPHFEYCCPLLLGIGKCQNKKLEKANYYALKTLLKRNNSTSYETVLKLATMSCLEQRRYEQSLILAFKSIKLHGPIYISNMFKLRHSNYNLRSNGQNFDQARYNTLYVHNSFSYIVSHIWNDLPLDIKNSESLSAFRNSIAKMDFTNKIYLGCRCMRCN